MSTQNSSTEYKEIDGFLEDPWWGRGAFQHSKGVFGESLTTCASRQLFENNTIHVYYHGNLAFMEPKILCPLSILRLICWSVSHPLQPQSGAAEMEEFSSSIFPDLLKYSQTFTLIVIITVHSCYMVTFFTTAFGHVSWQDGPPHFWNHPNPLSVA